MNTPKPKRRSPGRRGAAVAVVLALLPISSAATVISLGADGTYRVETEPVEIATPPIAAPPTPTLEDLAADTVAPSSATETLPPDIAALVDAINAGPSPVAPPTPITATPITATPVMATLAAGPDPSMILDPSTLDMLITPHLKSYPVLDRHLVQAVIHVESAGRIDAVSSKGAQGLMQLMPDTAQRLGVENAFDPAQNIRGGMAELARVMARHDDLTVALAAYNAGDGAVAKYEGIPPFPETQRYVLKVLRRVNQTQMAEIQALRAGDMVALAELGLARAHLPVAGGPLGGEVIPEDRRDTGPLLVNLGGDTPTTTDP